MGRKKSEEEDKIEQLEDQVRTLKSINKALVRRLKKLDKKFIYEDLEDTETQTKFKSEPPKKKFEYCPFCKKNELEVFEIVGRKIGKCNNCGKRTKAEKA